MANGGNRNLEIHTGWSSVQGNDDDCDDDAGLGCFADAALGIAVLQCLFSMWVRCARRSCRT